MLGWSDDKEEMTTKTDNNYDGSIWMFCLVKYPENFLLQPKIESHFASLPEFWKKFSHSEVMTVNMVKLEAGDKLL